jgi:hypothetical protein
MMTQMDAHKKLNRREFLSWLWGVLLLGLFGQAAAAMVQFFKPRLKPGGFGGEVVADARRTQLHYRPDAHLAKIDSP